MSVPNGSPRAAADLDEPLFGNYFVATYPPFYYWREEEVEGGLAALDAAAPEAPPPLGLYVHIPFCVERCQYCLYLSYSDRPEAKAGYVELLARELERWMALPSLAGRSAAFVYVGGGTPSLLAAAQLEQLFAGLRAVLPWQRAREVTFECAPRSVTERKVEVLRAAGVTRVSLGVQQLDDEVLRQNGRVHLVRDVERAWELLDGAGFTVRNVDLIAGLVGESDASFDASLERVIDLGPESVTIYQLEVPYNTPLYRSLRDGEVDAVAGWDVKRARVGRGFERLESVGYSVRSAYAAVRDPARHRFVYQDEQYHGADLLGIGASAFSHVDGVALQNSVAIDDYLSKIDAGRPATERAHRLTADERLIRGVILQLKLGRVDSAEIVRRYGADPNQRFAPVIERLVAAGWLERAAGDLVLTRPGLLRADRLLRLFYRDEHTGSRYS